LSISMYVVGIAMESMIFANQLFLCLQFAKSAVCLHFSRIFGCFCLDLVVSCFVFLQFVDQPFACLLEGSCMCGEGRICFFNQNDF